MKTPDILPLIEDYLPTNPPPDAQTVNTTAQEALRLVERTLQRDAAEAFAGREVELATILTLLVMAALYPAPNCRKDIRAAAAITMLEPYKANGGHTH